MSINKENLLLRYWLMENHPNIWEAFEDAVIIEGEKE